MDPVITTIISICMSLLFGVAAIHKLRAPAVFRAALDGYQLLPSGLLPLASILLIVMELLAATLILIPDVRLTGSAITGSLLFVYAAGISINLLRGRRDIDCGCNGPQSKQPLSWWLVIRNLVFLGLALIAMGPTNGRLIIWLDIITVAAAVLVAGVLYISLNQVLAQSPAMARIRNTT